MIESQTFVDAIISSCSEIFDMMLPLKLSEKMAQRPLPFEPLSISDVQDDVIASLGLTGEYSGSISLYLNLELSLKMAGWLMEETYTSLNSEVCESVGEIINMIAGGIKNRLSDNELEIFDLSTPIVISGPDKQIYHGKNMDYNIVPIETDHGMFFISLILDKT